MSVRYCTGNSHWRRSDAVPGLISPDKLRQYNLSVGDVDNALQLTNINTTGGFVDDNKGSEVLVRNLARANTLEDLANTVVIIKMAHLYFSNWLVKFGNQ